MFAVGPLNGEEASDGSTVHGSQDSPGAPQEATSQILEKDGSLKIVILVLRPY